MRCGASAGMAVARVLLLVAEIDRERAADDRLDAGAGHLLGEFQRPEHVVGVGERQRRLVVGLGQLGQLGDGQRAFQQRIGGVHVQVHEARACRRLCHRDSSSGRWCGKASGPVYRLGRGKPAVMPVFPRALGAWPEGMRFLWATDSEAGEKLRPDGNRRQKQADRRQSRGFFHNARNMILSPEKNEGGT